MKKLLVFLFTVLTTHMVLSQNSDDKKAGANKLLDFAKQNIHLVVETPKSKAKIGEKLCVEYRLYISLSTSVSDYAITKFPKNDGFSAQNIKMEGLSIEKGRYKGKSYQYVVIKKTYLTPTTSGKLTLDSMLMDLIVGVPSKDKDFFSNPVVKNIKISLTSNQKTIEVTE